MEGNRLTRSVSSLSNSRKEGSKASMARIRRLSDPKASSKPVTVVKKKLSNGPDIKKILAIMNLDKSKAATLPELKIKAIISQKSNGAKYSSISLDAGSRLNNEKKSHNDDVDDNPIIDKIVVMLEYEKPFIFVSHQDGDKHTMVKSKVRAQPTPMDIAEKSPTPTHLPVQTNSKQVIFDTDVVPEVMDKTQVRESSKGFRWLLKFGKKSHTTSTGDQSVDLDNSSVKIFEFDDKKTIIGSSSEVFIIKNLIAQDESPSGSASRKLSRHFSLFAPFRGKSTEKKVTT